MIFRILNLSLFKLLLFFSGILQLTIKILRKKIFSQIIMEKSLVNVKEEKVETRTPSLSDCDER